MSARPRAAGSWPPPGPLARTDDSVTTAWTWSWMVDTERTPAMAVAAQALVASRSQSWRIRVKSR